MINENKKTYSIKSTVSGIALAWLSNILFNALLIFVTPSNHIHIYSRCELPIRNLEWDFPLFFFDLFFYFGLTQFLYIFPMVYIFKKNNQFGLVRGLLIGAFAIFVINAYVLIDQKLVNNEISGTKTVSEVSAPNGDVDAYLLVNYTQKKTIKSSLGLGEDPPPTFSYYWVWIYQNSKFQSKNEMNNSYSDPCFKAENISPPDSLKVNWKGPEILEIHYKKARILNYHRTLRIQNQQGKDIFIKIKLVQDKPRK